VNQDERASQLSAMFDGELPAAECELLSRRLARDEQLRAVWSRYSVIGAVLRAEPVAQVRPDFARRVSAALAGGAGLPGARRGRLWRSAALASAVAAGVAGAAIMLLRSGLPLQEESLTAYVPSVSRLAMPAPAAVANRQMARGSDELASYVVPPPSTGNNLAVPAALAEYVVAHSEVSSPLARRSLLSALIATESIQPASAVPFNVTSADAAPVDGAARADGQR
jgi:sigma-E factor negative regulatory protein RseA